nr:phage tail protein [uncultured Kingella sp.]
MTLLGILGMFVFINKTIPYQSMDRSQSWKHPHGAIVGKDLPPSQFVGQDPEEITIKAELRPEITGGDGSIAWLRKMAATGQAYPLILGTGRLMGSFVITQIQETQSELMYDGKARSISFTMTLKKVSEHSFGLGGEALGLAVGMVRMLGGV